MVSMSRAIHSGDSSDAGPWLQSNWYQQKNRDRDRTNAVISGRTEKWRCVFGGRRKEGLILAQRHYCKEGSPSSISIGLKPYKLGYAAKFPGLYSYRWHGWEAGYSYIMGSSSVDSRTPAPEGDQTKPSRLAGGGKWSRPGLFRLYLLAMAALTILFLATAGHLNSCPWPAVCSPLKAVDISQGRLDTALPAPQDGIELIQRFTPSRNGLTEIELILVRYDPAEDRPPDSRFMIELLDSQGRLIASRSHAAAELSHNQTYTLQIPPQVSSGGQQYSLRLTGTAGNPVSVWGYRLDVTDRGELEIIGTDANAAEMRFVTRYALQWADIPVILGQFLINDGALLALTLVFLFLPGCLLLSIGRPYRWDGAAWWGAALALGVAVWPILWFWLSLLGGRWTGVSLWVLVGLGWGLVIYLAVRRSRLNQASTRPPVDRSAVLIHGLLTLLLMVSVSSRFVAVRDLGFPPWVDSSRHALITAAMAETGQTPVDYGSFLPVDRFPYHFGFHTISASLYLMTGRELPALLLAIGQLLNGLVPLSIYTAGWMVTRRRAVGLVAAFLVALPFYFPGYYATWGRMTQITAMIVLPVLIALTWRVGRGWPRVWPLVGLLAAGLFLIHFRVFLFYLPFALLVAVFSIHRWRIWVLLKAGGLAVLLVLPRLIQLARQTDPGRTIQQSLPGYNDFPIGYLTTGWERLFLGLTAIALSITLVGLIRRRRWVLFPLVLAAWVGALFLLLAGERLGLPESLVVNLNSMYISLFLPISLFLAIVAGEVWRWAGRLPWPLDQTIGEVGWRVIALLAGIALGVLALFGWRQQSNILNQQTILALPQDKAGLDWIEANLPADALVAVNAWQWLGATWAGSDGGAWVVPLTGRQSTTPPVDHIYNPALFAWVRGFNEKAFAVDDWSQPSAVQWLRAKGVTHIMVGARGGYFDPAELSRNPALERLFGQDGVFIFGIRE